MLEHDPMNSIAHLSFSVNFSSLHANKQQYNKPIKIYVKNVIQQVTSENCGPNFLVSIMG